MNYQKSNGKRRKLYTSINTSNNGNQVNDVVLASQIRNINKIKPGHYFKYSFNEKEFLKLGYLNLS